MIAMYCNNNNSGARILCSYQFISLFSSNVSKSYYLEFSHYTAGSTPRPTLPKLVKLDLPSQVAPNISTFGILLLEDKYGNKMDIIKKKALGDPLEMAIEVLREWLAGRGVEVTWESLIDTLRDCELTVMAEQIQMSLDQKSL